MRAGSKPSRAGWLPCAINARASALQVNSFAGTVVIGVRRLIAAHLPCHCAEERTCGCVRYARVGQFARWHTCVTNGEHPSWHLSTRRQLSRSSSAGPCHALPRHPRDLPPTAGPFRLCRGQDAPAERGEGGCGSCWAGGRWWAGRRDESGGHMIRGLCVCLWAEGDGCWMSL
jgi:hypothetical protein